MIKSENQASYNRRLKELKESIVKRLTNSEGLSDIKKVLEYRNYYQVEISQDKNVDDALQILTDIFNIDDMSELDEIAENLSDEIVREFQKIVKDYRNPYQICKKEHIEGITDYSAMNESEISEKEGIEFEQREGVSFYKLKGIPFRMLIHDGNFDGNAFGGRTNELHTSLISNDIQNTIYGARRLFVFNQISPSNINWMLTRDIAEDSRYEVNRNEEGMLLPNEFMANIEMEGNHWAYSDIQLNFDGGLQPDAICVKGDIKDVDIEYAKQRGIKTIYSIDEEAYKDIDTNKEDFYKILEEYKKSFSPKLLATLKMKNPYSREEFLNILQDVIAIEKAKDSKDKKLINTNIDAIKRIYRRDIQMAAKTSSKTNDDFIQQISDIEDLREDEEIVIEEGSKEDIYYKKLINIRALEGILNDKNSNWNTSYDVNDILENSDDIERDVNIFLKIIQDNCNVEDIDKYSQMLCAIEDKFQVDELYEKMLNNSASLDEIYDGEDKEIIAKIIETRKQIKLKNLKQQERFSSKGKVNIFSYFFEKSNEAKKIIESIEHIGNDVNNEKEDNKDDVLHYKSTQELGKESLDVQKETEYIDDTQQGIAIEERQLDNQQKSTEEI